ncbi:hypothetical protein Taro_000484 [Colocasia esculenta]|uniref:Uncharacterized protein n=1 Tax=Colocasia esculenta TaxID=4460 RepID=A0A843TAX7_COLES|nr:hypothetical protein [Colocasia esculenta]
MVSSCPGLHSSYSLAVSRFLRLCQLALWAVFRAFRFAGPLGVSCVDAVSVTRSLVPFVVALVGSTCGPSTLWRSEMAVPMVRRCFSHGCSVSLMVTPGCSFPTSWRSGLLGACVVRLWSYMVAPVFRELLYLGGCMSRVASFPAGFGCELQESVAAVAGCACFELGCWFARAAFGFVVGLCVRVGVSRRLREPACGVAFTGVELWSAEPLLRRCPLVEVHRLDAVFWWCFPELFVVVLVRVLLPLGLLLCSLKSSVVLPPWFEASVVWLVATVLPSRLSCCATSGLRYAAVVLAIAFWRVFPERRFGGSGGGSSRTSLCCFCCLLCSLCWPFVELRSGDGDPEWLLALWVEVLPKLPCVVSFVAALSLSVEMSCRCFQLDCPCYSLPGCFRSRCDASDRVYGRGVGQFVFLIVFRVSRLHWWDFVCSSGSGGWLHFLTPCGLCQMVRLVVRVSFPYFPLVARGGGASRAVGAVSCTVVKGSVPCVQGEAAPDVLLFGLLVQASFQCVFCLCLGCAREALVTVWCVALLTCGGRSGALCALSFPPLGHHVLADALWLYRYHCGVAALPCLGSPIGGAPGIGRGLCPGFPSRLEERGCLIGVPYFGLDPPEVDVLSSTSVVVLIFVQFVDVLSCLALPTSDVFLDFASVHVPVERVF